MGVQKYNFIFLQLKLISVPCIVASLAMVILVNSAISQSIQDFLLSVLPKRIYIICILRGFLRCPAPEGWNICSAAVICPCWHPLSPANDYLPPQVTEATCTSYRPPAGHYLMGFFSRLLTSSGPQGESCY